MSLPKEVLKQAKTFIGMKAGKRGECFDLADEALRAANAKTASDYKPVRENDDYIWGTEIQLSELDGGDILQMRGYKMVETNDSVISISFPDDSGIDYSEIEDFTVEHKNNHTAVASSAASAGKLNVLDQNIDRGTGVKERIVKEREFYVRSPPDKTTSSSRQVMISTAWGEKVKKGYDLLPDKKQVKELKAYIDAIVKKYNGQSFSATVETTVTISVTGTLWAYRAEPK